MPKEVRIIFVGHEKNEPQINTGMEEINWTQIVRKEFEITNDEQMPHANAEEKNRPQIHWEKLSVAHYKEMPHANTTFLGPTEWQRR